MQASALKLTVIVSLVITILLGGLISLYAYHQRHTDRFFRQSTLLQVMDNALSIAQSSYLPYTDTLLYGVPYNDSNIRIQKSVWGLYDVATVCVHDEIDSLRKAFLLGSQQMDTVVLYVADEDRNLSVSGNTRIKGNASLPQAGIKPAFVDGKYYEGKEIIIEGKKRYSERELPAIAHHRINPIYSVMPHIPILDFRDLPDQQGQSFFLPTIHAHSPAPIDLSHYELAGNIVLYSDTAIHIGQASNLKQLICIAPFISVEADFRGSLQLFATDSISIGERTILEYPSAVVLQADRSEGQKKLLIQKDSQIHGTILLSEEERSPLPHNLEFGENCTVYGDLICFGMLQYKKNLSVHGATYCYRFITQTPSSLYENYLIDLELDRAILSPHFLHGYVWNIPQEKQINQILTWLD